MDRRLSHALLALGVFGLASADWLVLPAGADPETDTEARAPAVLPEDAFVDGAVPEAAFGPVRLAVRPAPGGYIMRFVNTSEREVEVPLEIECASESGSPMSRMGPVRSILMTERVNLRLPPGGSLERLLAVPGRTGGQNVDDAANAGWMRTVTSVDFVVRRTAAEPGAEPSVLARLHLVDHPPAAPAQAGGPGNRG